MSNIITLSGVSGYLDENGTAFLKLEDVARGLGFVERKKDGAEYVRWGTVSDYLSEIGFSQEVAKDGFIPENIFYRLAMKAKNETAERFQALVADEILPTIRKTGGYVANEDTFIRTYLPYADAQTQELFRATLTTVRSLNSKIEADRPKVLFADAVSASKTSILVGEMAKILKQNGIDTGQNRFFDWLRTNGYLIRRKGTDYNMPTQTSMEKGLFEIKETSIVHADGHTSINKTPKITGRGQQYFVDRFLGRERG